MGSAPPTADPDCSLLSAPQAEEYHTWRLLVAHLRFRQRVEDPVLNPDDGSDYVRAGAAPSKARTCAHTHRGTHRPSHARTDTLAQTGGRAHTQCAPGGGLTRRRVAGQAAAAPL